MLTSNASGSTCTTVDFVTAYILQEHNKQPPLEGIVAKNSQEARPKKAVSRNVVVSWFQIIAM